MLFDNPADGEKKVQVFEPLIDQRATAMINEVKATYALQAAQRRVAASEPAMTAEEKDASTLLIECVNGSSFSGCNAAPPSAGSGQAGAGGGRGRGGGGGGRGGGAAWLAANTDGGKADPPRRKKNPLRRPDLPSRAVGPIAPPHRNG